MSDFSPNSGPQRRIQSYVLGAILVLLFLAVGSILSPFFSALLWAFLLFIMLRPLHRRVTGKLNPRTFRGKILRNFWAALFAAGAMLLVFVPLSFVVITFFRQIIDILDFFRERLDRNPEYLQNLFSRFSVFVRNISGGQIEIGAGEIENQLRDFFAGEIQRIITFSSGIVRNIGNFFVTMLLVLFSMFFFFVDGPYLGRLVQNAIPIRKDYFTAITAKFMETTRTLFFGYIIVAFIQSFVAFLIYTVFGVDGALVLAVITFVLVFIPMFGAVVIYLPLSVIRIAGGDIGGGILLFTVSVVFISGIDNLLRPYFLKDRIQLHPLIIFLAILGGVIVFGFNGLILGPTLVILFLTVLDLFLAEHKIKKQEAAEQDERPGAP